MVSIDRFLKYGYWSRKQRGLFLLFVVYGIVVALVWYLPTYRGTDIFPSFTSTMVDIRLSIFGFNFSYLYVSTYVLFLWTTIKQKDWLLNQIGRAHTNVFTTWGMFIVFILGCIVVADLILNFMGFEYQFLPQLQERIFAWNSPP